MEKVITYSLSEKLIPKIAEVIEREYIANNKPLEKAAFIFSGRRPSLFLARELASRVKKSFLPPKFFSIEDFTGYLADKQSKKTQITQLDSAYIIYNLAKTFAPSLLANRETFARFLPWAGEISSFIDMLDIERVDNKSVRSVEKNAEIGYDVPDSINGLLKQIATIREKYRETLEKSGRRSRGTMYGDAVEWAKKGVLNEFDAIYFCNFFYLNKSEKEIMKALYEKKKATLVFQGDDRSWPILKENAEYFNCLIRPGASQKPDYKLKLYSGYDTHSQAEIVREIAKEASNPESSVLVVPDSASIIPVLAEIAPVVGEFNVSLGYPLKRSSLYTLIKYILEAQSTIKDGQYYAKSYLNAIRHPLAKNLNLGAGGPEVTRTLVHKVEEVLSGKIESNVSGSLFVKLTDIENLQVLFDETGKTLSMHTSQPGQNEAGEALQKLHKLLFGSWDKITTFGEFASVLESFIMDMSASSRLAAYPLNAKTAKHLLDVSAEFAKAGFGSEKLLRDDIFKIASDQLDGKYIPFTGSPLKGFQILGVLESRSLSFDNVIIMDMNESVFPNLKLQNALIPRDIMLSLGLSRVEKEEEIIRYQFESLISGAKNVHLIWAEDAEHERSRYVEALVWEEQKKSGDIQALKPVKPKFVIGAVPAKKAVMKTEKMLEKLEGMEFSPTLVDTYLKCPKRFYFKAIMGLEESEDLGEEPEASDIGNYVHDVLNIAFSPYLGKKPVIDQDFKKQFAAVRDDLFNKVFSRRMKSDGFLLKTVIDYRLDWWLKNEKDRVENQVEILEAVESKKRAELKLGSKTFKFKGRVDRIDKLITGENLVIDYKTGNSGVLPGKIEGLIALEKEFSRREILRVIKSLQVPAYCEMIKLSEGKSNINGAIYDIREAKLKKYLDDKTEDDKKLRASICLKALGFIMNEITDKNIPFNADDTKPESCQTCPYFYICR